MHRRQKNRQIPQFLQAHILMGLILRGHDTCLSYSILQRISLRNAEMLAEYKKNIQNSCKYYPKEWDIYSLAVYNTKKSAKK